MGRVGLLMMVIVALGCTTPQGSQVPDAKPTAEAEKPKVEPAVAEPVKTEPVVAEPVKTEPEPVKTEPVKTEPVKTEPVKTTPVKTEPVKAEPVKAEPVKTEPVKTEPVKATPVKAEPVAAPDKKTERTWKSKCGSCHGADGKAATEKGRKMKMSDLTLAAWQTSRTNAQLKKAIVEGVKTEKGGVKQEMDGFPDLSPEQVEEFVKYVRWLGSAH